MTACDFLCHLCEQQRNLDEDRNSSRWKRNFSNNTGATPYENEVEKLSA
jgi:hypothetical protein